MEIYIVRHGETVWNKEKRLQGTADIKLNEFGRALAIETGRNLANVTINKIFSSPLKRAYETASLIRGNRDIEIETDDRIRELNFGDYEGQCFNDLFNDESTTFQQFFKHPELFVADKKLAPHFSVNLCNPCKIPERVTRVCLEAGSVVSTHKRNGNAMGKLRQESYHPVV